MRALKRSVQENFLGQVWLCAKAGCLQTTGVRSGSGLLVGGEVGGVQIDVAAARGDDAEDREVDVADGGNDEGVLHANVVGETAFEGGENGSSDDGLNHETGAFAGEFAKACDSQSEDAGEHDGVEEPDCDDAGHGYVAAGEHGGDDQAAGDESGSGESFAGADVAQDPGADEASDHRSSPVEGDVVGGGFFAEAEDMRKAEIVNTETAGACIGCSVC